MLPRLKAITVGTRGDSGSNADQMLLTDLMKKKTLLPLVVLVVSTAPSLAAMSCRQWMKLPLAEQPAYHMDLINNWAMFDERSHSSIAMENQGCQTPPPSTPRS